MLAGGPLTCSPLSLDSRWGNQLRPAGVTLLLTWADGVWSGSGPQFGRAATAGLAPRPGPQTSRSRLAAPPSRP